MKGEVKPALARLRESRAARARELSEEVLAVQERLDAGLEALTERTEENAGLGTQVLFCPQPVSPCHLSLLSTVWAAYSSAYPFGYLICFLVAYQALGTSADCACSLAQHMLPGCD